MSETFALDILRQAVLTALLAAMPMLVTALVIGIVISILQTATSIQEQTLIFIPKIVGVLISLVIFGPWIFSIIGEFARQLFSNIFKLGG